MAEQPSPALQDMRSEETSLVKLHPINGNAAPKLKVVGYCIRNNRCCHVEPLVMLCSTVIQGLLQWMTWVPSWCNFSEPWCWYHVDSNAVHWQQCQSNHNGDTNMKLRNPWSGLCECAKHPSTPSHSAAHQTQSFSLKLVSFYTRPSEKLEQHIFWTSKPLIFVIVPSWNLHLSACSCMVLLFCCVAESSMWISLTTIQYIKFTHDSPDGSIATPPGCSQP